MIVAWWNYYLYNETLDKQVFLPRELYVEYCSWYENLHNTGGAVFAKDHYQIKLPSSPAPFATWAHVMRHIAPIKKASIEVREDTLLTFETHARVAQIKRNKTAWKLPPQSVCKTHLAYLTGRLPYG